MSTRLVLPSRRHHITQTVRIASQRTRYISVYDDTEPGGIFLSPQRSGRFLELISSYDVIASL